MQSSSKSQPLSQPQQTPSNIPLIPVNPSPTTPSQSSQGSSSSPSPAQNPTQTTQNPTQTTPANGATGLPLHPPTNIDLRRFNELVGDWVGKPVDDMSKLFVKKVILDDQTAIDVETIKVPGFIGITDALTVIDASGKQVSGHEDIAKWLGRDGLYICTFQWHKERYGEPIDTRRPMEDTIFIEAFMKNEGHHSGAIVPAKRFGQPGRLIDSFGTFNEPNDYHRGMYGKDGYVAVAQRLVFPNFVTPVQARGYTDSIICWMALLNPYVQFPADYNGGDPTNISDRASLKEFLRNGLLAALGDQNAIAFFKDPLQKCYCAEFMYVSLNTPIYPFNKQGLSLLLDGDTQKVERILEMQKLQNERRANTLSVQTTNPEFKAYNIPMPVVPETLPPLDVLMAQNGQTVESNSIPFPPFKISHVIRRAFRTLLPRQQAVDDMKIARAQARMFKFMEPALIQQLGLQGKPETDPQVVAVKQFVASVSQQLEQPFPNYAAFNQAMDACMAQADQMLAGDGARSRFVPPRIYVDLGQKDNDASLPKGWGFHLETVGALVARSVIK
ncbi:MAG: hypothetical protein K6T90_17825 [Leptolyngbyaceae cyanobacterium HOT.MB2.61]|jgi:hypothetical protein|nr:hypothetical protein [Leptolyngbyaceae cyanobacterium HOT.MB2.61]